MKRTTIMADEEMLYRVERLAQKTGKSKAAIIREALAEYVTKAEQAEPDEHPLMALVGIADVEGEEIPPIDEKYRDLSNGNDEALLAEIYNEKYERTLAEFEKYWEGKDGDDS